MNFMILLKRLEKYTSDNDLQNLNVTANKINGISFLLIKDCDGKVEDCIILEDGRFAPKVSVCERNGY